MNRTTRLTAAVLAATTAFALAACGSDDTEDTSTDQAVETNPTSDDTGASVDDFDLLSAGETLTSTGVADSDAVYELTFDNVSEQDGQTCVDSIFNIVTPSREQIYKNTDRSTEEFQIELGHAGIPFGTAKVYPVTDDTVSADSVEATVDIDRDGDTLTQEVCFDAGDADAVMIESDMNGDLDQDIDGWRIDL